MSEENKNIYRYVYVNNRKCKINLKTLRGKKNKKNILIVKATLFIRLIYVKCSLNALFILQKFPIEKLPTGTEDIAKTNITHFGLHQ